MMDAYKTRKVLGRMRFAKPDTDIFLRPGNLRSVEVPSAGKREMHYVNADWY